MFLFKKLAVIILGLCLISLTGCQSNDASSSQKSSTAETHHSKAKTSSKEDINNEQSASVDTNNSDDQSSSDQANSNQSSDDKNNSAPKQTTPPSDANNNDTNKPSNNATPSKYITSVRVADSQTGWVGGEGWIAKTKDGGENWQVQYQGEQTVHQLFALDHQNVWATFDNASNSSSGLRLLNSNDGGGHWTAVGRVPNQGFLHFISKTTGFIANAETMDGGRDWKTLPTPKGIVGDAYFHDTKNGWAVTKGKDVFQVMKTTDGGHSWSSVMSKKISGSLNGVMIRSAGKLDAWVECIGGSGMTQTSYSLFHTVDGGKTWQVVIANSTAGGGPAPGFSMADNNGPHNQGSSPGMLYVLNPNTAFMSGQCEACDKPNTIGWTNNGGKTWTNGKAQLTGYGPNLLAFADANHGWWITTEYSKPSVLYITSDGGKQWSKIHTFK